MDPISVIGLVGSVVGIVDAITKSVAYLSGLQSSYKIVDLKVTLVIGQLSTLKAALDQVADLINAKPDVPRNQKLHNDLSVALACVEAVIFALDDQLFDLQRNENQGLKTLSKVRFMWDEQTINDYLGLLDNQVNALNLFLTALQCRTTVEQAQVVEGLECQSLLRLVRDDTSSLLWLRDSESIGTCRSVGTQDLATINADFGFDMEVFASKAYRTATRSSMLCGLLMEAPPGDQNILDGDRGRRSQRVFSGSFGEAIHEQHPGHRNTELQRLHSSSTLPKCATNPLDALQTLPPGTLTVSSRSDARQQRVEGHVARFGLVRPSSPTTMTNLKASFESQRPQQTVKVLLLGTSRSGKSTLIKSLKMRYMGGYNKKERRDYAPTVLKSLWVTTKVIAEALAVRRAQDAGEISQQEREEQRTFLAAYDVLKASNIDAVSVNFRPDISWVMQLRTTRKKPQFRGKPLSPTVSQLRQMVEEQGRAEKQLYDEMEMLAAASNVLQASNVIEGVSNLRLDISWAIGTIWNKTHQVLEEAILTDTFNMVDTARHFAKSSRRILYGDYVPTDEDILYSRSETTGAHEIQLVHGDTAYQFFDFGGTSIEREKWVHSFGEANAVVFTCDVSCYNAALAEDSTQNSMYEQLHVFESIVNSESFADSQIVVLFTKEYELTARNLLASPFQAIFPDYDGHPEDVVGILNYLVFRLRNCARNGTSNVVFCRSGGLFSPVTSMAEVVINALQERLIIS